MSDAPTPAFVRAYGAIEQLDDYRFKNLARLVYSSTFELLIAFVILSNAIALAILTFPSISRETRAAAEAVDLICFVIYVCELVLRMISYGRKPWMFFKQGWNIYDFVIVGAAPFFSTQTVVLRLLRLFRLLRIFRFLPEVRVLSASIVKSVPPLMSMAALIGLLIFIYGMVGTYLFGSELTKAWGTIGNSMMSLFILLTLENFPIYLEEALAINILALPFFLSYVFVIVFTVLNLLIGIVLNAMDEARQENREQSRKLSEFQALSDELNEITKDGRVTDEEVQFIRRQIDNLRR